MTRLFVALTPSPQIAAALIAAMGGVAGARWQNADQLHLTLSFLGDVRADQLPCLDGALAAIRAAPIALSCSGVGHFASKGHATTLWADAQPAKPLTALAVKIDHVVRAIGIVPQGMRFMPHITMARLNRSTGSIDGFLVAQAGLSTPTAIVTECGLFESHLGSGGARYTLISAYPLRI
ncbi:MAG: RNA 2',3'-cyclic phosphodiesterase [Sphingopyxis sp.]